MYAKVGAGDAEREEKEWKELSPREDKNSVVECVRIQISYMSG